MSYAMDRPPVYAQNNAPAADIEAQAYYHQDGQVYSPQTPGDHYKYETQGSTPGEFQGEQVYRENWKQWLPERTPGLIAWFTFFSLLSLALTIVALFGCVSNTMSNLYMARLEPYSILNASKQYLLDNSTPTHKNESNTTTIRDHDFFTHPLPWRYQVGMGGVCRLYNNTDLSDPLMTSTTICTRHLHPQLDLLNLIATDIPDAAESKQYQNWVALLNQVSPGFEAPGKVAQRASLLFAASVFLVMSVAWVVLTLIATLVWPPMYPKWSMLSEIFEALLMIGACVMWAVVAGQVSTGYLSDGSYAQGVHSGSTYGVLWAIPFAKLAVTPMLLYVQIKIVMAVVGAAMKVITACLDACATTPRRAVVIVY